MLAKFFVLLLALSTSCGSNIIDLSWDYDNDTIAWKGVQPFTYTKKIEEDSRQGFWYAVKEFCVGEHGGTHLDAPFHFFKEGWKVSDIPVGRLVARGAVVDIRNVVKQLGPNAQLLVEHLEQWQQTNGPFQPNTVLLVKFGWSQYWPDRKKYMGNDIDGTPQFPGISAAAAQWIVDTGKIVGVGLDTPSVDPGNQLVFETHRIFAKNQLYNLENVKLTEDLPSKAFTLVVSPMKLKEGTGAPVRILALLNMTHILV